MSKGDVKHPNFPSISPISWLWFPQSKVIHSCGLSVARTRIQSHLSLARLGPSSYHFDFGLPVTKKSPSRKPWLFSVCFSRSLGFTHITINIHEPFVLQNGGHDQLQRLLELQGLCRSCLCHQTSLGNYQTKWRSIAGKVILWWIFHRHDYRRVARCGKWGYCFLPVPAQSSSIFQKVLGIGVSWLHQTMSVYGSVSGRWSQDDDPLSFLVTAPIRGRARMLFFLSLHLRSLPLHLSRAFLCLSSCTCLMQDMWVGWGGGWGGCLRSLSRHWQCCFVCVCCSSCSLSRHWQCCFVCVCSSCTCLMGGVGWTINFSGRMFMLGCCADNAQSHCGKLWEKSAEKKALETPGAPAKS